MPGRSKGHGKPKSERVDNHQERKARKQRQRSSVRNRDAPKLCAQDYGTKLKEFRADDLAWERDEDEEVKIQNVSYVASYNWLDKSEPTIVIPGQPPRWTPLPGAQQLPKGDGIHYRDNNAASFPKHPTEPAVRAYLQALPATASPDVFACDNTMHNLLNAVRKTGSPFHFLVEVVGNTVFLVRRQHPADARFDPKHLGYSHKFLEKYTTWDVPHEDSKSHQRLISYSFGGLKCVVRYEPSAYMADLAVDVDEDAAMALEPEPDDPAAVGPASAGPSRVLAELNEFGNQLPNSVEDSEAIAALKALKLDLEPEDPNTTRPGSPDVQPEFQVLVESPVSSANLKVFERGTRIPQAATVNIMTNSINTMLAPAAYESRMGLLWLTQTPNFVLSQHLQGHFDDVEVHNVAPNVRSWEEGEQRALRRLNVLLRDVIKFAKERKDGRFEVHSTDPGVLMFREPNSTAKTALPAELKNWWVARAGACESDGSDHEDELDTVMG